MIMFYMPSFNNEMLNLFCPLQLLDRISNNLDLLIRPKAFYDGQ